MNIKPYNVFLLSFVLLCFLSCGDPFPVPTKPVLSDEGSSDKTTRPRRSYLNHRGTFVSIGDIQNYIKRDYPATRSLQAGEARIDPYLDGSSGDTLMYIINYPNGQGWKILSADARTPAVIAFGNEGSFSLQGAGGAVAAWMEGVGQDLRRVRNSTDDELTFSDEQIAGNRAFWADEPTRLNPEDPIGEEGYWEETTTTQLEYINSIDHLTPQWCQRPPYNQYCPFASDGLGGRARAGCVAVAGAHVLYYLHKKLGVPQTMVSQASFDAPNNEWNFSTPSYTVWESMDTLSNYNYPYAFSDRPEALMIGYIGKTINMNYGGSFSWTLPLYLRTNLFNPAGISCSHGDYDQSILANSLLNEMPVIITATNLLIPIDFDIHTFVADAYMITRTRFIHWHHWVGPTPSPDPGAGSVVLEPGEYGDYTTYTYSSPALTHIKFNWGWPEQWGESHLNDGWYSLTSGWTVHIDDNTSYDYNYNRQMIYGFAVTN